MANTCLVTCVKITAARETQGDTDTGHSGVQILLCLFFDNLSPMPHT